MTSILLVINIPIQGCEYHRQYAPYNRLALDMPEEYSIAQINTLDWKYTDTNFKEGYGLSRREWLRQFDIVIFGRSISRGTNHKAIADDCRAAGCTIILDMDDFWRVSKSHINHKTHKQQKIAEHILSAVRLADIVTTTTPYLAEQLSLINPFTVIHENAIDPEGEHPDNAFKQWEIMDHPKSYTRLGWVGGICHREDMQTMAPGIGQLWRDKELFGKFQLVLGGFTMGETKVIKVRDKTGIKDVEIPCEPGKQTHVYFEKVFTDDYKCFLTQPNYLTYLLQYNRTHLEIEDKLYRRIWAEDTFTYGKFYNEWDVTLIPLNNNHFNRCKSQLKVIESGFMGKAVIATGIIPYIYDIIDGENGLLVSPNDERNGWYNAARRMINDKDMREAMAAKLHEHVMKNYHMRVINAKRHELLQKIMGEKTSRPQAEEARNEREHSTAAAGIE